MDPWATVFLGCFLFGILFIGISFILGSFGGQHSDTGHSGSHAEVGHGNAGNLDPGHGEPGHIHVDVQDAQGHAGNGHDSPSHGPSLINLNTITMFLTWFGGIGYILRVYSGFGLVFIVPLSILFGGIGAALIYLFLARVIYPNVDKEQYMGTQEQVGTIAKVSSGIQANGFGEIVYSKGGTRRIDGARSEDGKPIARGTEVVITRYEHGTAYVQPFEAFLAASDELNALPEPSGTPIPEMPEHETISRKPVE